MHPKARKRFAFHVSLLAGALLMVLWAPVRVRPSCRAIDSPCAVTGPYRGYNLGFSPGFNLVIEFRS